MAGLRAAGVILIWFAAPSFGLAQVDPDLKTALALERALQKVVEKAEPAIACVLVARTELYQKFGQDPAEAAKGKLGRFNPAAVFGMGLKKLDKEALVQKLDMAHPKHVPESFGSGVVIDPKGLILTNYHVIRDATKVYVRLPGGTGSYADIHAADGRSDLAVLRLLDTKGGPFSPVKYGDAGTLKRGQLLVTLANPFAAGFRDARPSVSLGVLSNVRRRVLGMRKEEEGPRLLHMHGSLLQVDARINLGSSGGALLDLEGNLVGVLTAWAGVVGGDTPGGFAIPIDTRFRRIAEVLARGEEIDYGFLGISLSNKDEDENGALVEDAYRGSPAARAHLKKGDRVTAVDGEPIENSDDLFLLLGGHLAGTKVQVEYLRPGFGKKKAMVTLAKLWSPGKRIVSSLGARPFVLGMRVDDASILVQQVPLWSEVPQGVVLAEVEEGSPAVRAKLGPGDVITHVGGREVHSPAEFYRAMEGKMAPVEFTLHPSRIGGAGAKVVVK